MVVRLRRISSVIFPDFGNLFKQVDHPDFADESGDTDEQNVFSGKRLADAEVVDSRSGFKPNNGWSVDRELTFRLLNCGFDSCVILTPSCETN